MRSRAVRALFWAAVLVLAPVALWACPRCVDATPYKTGMLLAVLVLLPLPIVMGFLLYRWIQRAEKSLS